LPKQSEQESSEVYLFLRSLLSKARGGFEISRVGGSNGMAHVLKEFFRMLPGITPRKFCAVMWFPMQTKWLFFYISPYKEKHHLSCREYSQPMPGGQVQISNKTFYDERFPKYLQTSLVDFITIKSESAPLVSSLNTSIFKPYFGIAACLKAIIIQEMMNYIARLCVRKNGCHSHNNAHFMHLLTLCSFTIVAYATRLDVDTPKHHPFLPYQGFWENKWVINVPLYSMNNSNEPALGQGGAGPGRFTFAILDHSYNMCNAYGWGDQSEAGNGALF
jgi:hypothetical protein